MPKPIEIPSPFEIEESYLLDNVPFDINSALIIKALSGSHAYGMARVDSDIDIRGVFVAPFANKVQLDREVKVVKTPEGQGDLVYHEIQKFCQLVARMDANSTQLLFTPPHAILHLDECGKALMDSREAFLNNRVRYSFGGFAFGNTTQAINTRSQSHPQIREQFGYDTVMAMHSVRLCRLGAELLATGSMTMIRKDAAELLAIRGGRYTRDEFAIVEKRPTNDGTLKDEIVGGFMAQEYANLMEAYEHTILPEQPDNARINRIMQRITGHKLGIKIETETTHRPSPSTRSF